MRKLLILFPLLFSTVMFPSPSYAEWTKVTVSVAGNTHYMDFERIRKVGGYVYFWDMVNYLKLTEEGDLSAKEYKEGDCKLFRYKGLSFSFHKEPMGGGTGITYNPKNPEWIYPTPNSLGEITLKKSLWSVS